MTDEQLATACPRLDQAAYLAGLQTVARIENKRMRQRMYPGGYGETTRPMPNTHKDRRYEERQRKRAAVVKAIPPGQIVTAAEIAAKMGKKTSQISGILSALANDGLVTRFRPDDVYEPMRWARR